MYICSSSPSGKAKTEVLLLPSPNHRFGTVGRKNYVTKSMIWLFEQRTFMLRFAAQAIYTSVVRKQNKIRGLQADNLQ